MLHLGLFCLKLLNTTELLSQLEQRGKAEQACASQGRRSYYCGLTVAITEGTKGRTLERPKMSFSCPKKMMHSVLADVAAIGHPAKPC